MQAEASLGQSRQENSPIPWPTNATGREAYPGLDDTSAFRAFFEREGFVLVRGMIKGSQCDAAVDAFRREVLPERHAWFERHASGRHERHVYTRAGHMKYPIMNLQDLSPRRYPGFRQHGLNLLTAPAIQQAIGILCGEPGRAIHTMYFDGNQATWAHRDGHYIDSQRAGGMIGVWVAAEDIDPRAGRFFILPRSHRMPIPGEEDDPNGADYKARMAEFVRHGPLECVAPIMRRGDFLLWTSLTIHGSLPTEDERYSRRSFTAHYVPQSHQFEWKTHGGVSQRFEHVNGVEIVLHRQGLGMLQRLRHAVRDELPRVYGWALDCKHRVSQAIRRDGLH